MINVFINPDALTRLVTGPLEEKLAEIRRLQKLPAICIQIAEKDLVRFRECGYKHVNQIFRKSCSKEIIAEIIRLFEMAARNTQIIRIEFKDLELNPELSVPSGAKASFDSAVSVAVTVAEKETDSQSIYFDIDIPTMPEGAHEVTIHPLKIQPDEYLTPMPSVISRKLQFSSSSEILAKKLKLSFKSPSAAVALASEYFYSNIEFLDSAIKSAELSPFVNTHELFHLFADISGATKEYRIKNSKALEAGAKKRKRTGISRVDFFVNYFEGKSNFRYRPRESNKTLNLYRESYKFTYNGAKQIFDEHVTIGSDRNPQNCISVHWIYHEGKTIIGYVGNHLPLASD